MPLPLQMVCQRTAVSLSSYLPEWGTIPPGEQSALCQHHSHAAETILQNGGQAKVQKTYEDGGLIIFDSAGNTMLKESDWHFLNSFQTGAKPDNRLKKAKMPDMLAPLPDDYNQHVMSLLGLTRDQAARLQGLIKKVNAYLRKLVGDLFPRYKVVGEGVTWRLTQTETEEMHFDSYGVATDENQKIRLFVNIDDKPRLWATSHVCTDAIRIYAGRLKGRDCTHPPNQFNNTLNKTMPWHEVPRNFFAFAPGSMWLVNSQIVSHEIIFGRKMIGFTCDVDPASMDAPEKSFQNITRKALRQQGLIS